MDHLRSVKFRLKFKQVLWISFAWFWIGALDAVYLHAVTDNPYVHRVEGYRFTPVLLVSSIGFAFSGLFAGSLLIYLKERFRDKTFLYFLLVNTGLVLMLAIVMNICSCFLYFKFLLQKPFLHPDVWQATLDIVTNPINFKNLSFGLLLTIGTAVALQVNDKYGPGVFFNLLIGRYHHPREEERIFMFLDIKSSTTIAEQIEHVKFHNLLSEFFRDITDPIIYTKGEVYQYVGDEVVISWRMKPGPEQNNCIQCFYEMEQAIAKRANKYRNKYDCVPEFKAGMHCGKVTVGEIGVLKKDIVFSGDVLNTTARIQSKCNDFGVKILLSETLLQMLNLAEEGLNPQNLGEITLKGKSEKIVLYTLGDKLNTL